MQSNNLPVVIVDLSCAKDFYSRTMVSKNLSFREFVDTCFSAWDVDDVLENTTHVLESMIDYERGGSTIEPTLDDDFFMQMAYEALFETVNELFNIDEHTVRAASNDKNGIICIAKTPSQLTAGCAYSRNRARTR